MTGPHGIPWANLDRAAQIYVDALAERDSMAVDDAARAAGARSPAEVERIGTLIRTRRQALAPGQPLFRPHRPT